MIEVCANVAFFKLMPIFGVTNPTTYFDIDVILFNRDFLRLFFVA
jgi:hypothetical protein